MRDVVYKTTGWSIRHFMIMRNNYFGAFTHFSTLYEYLEKRKLGQPLGDLVDLQYREGSVGTSRKIVSIRAHFLPVELATGHTEGVGGFWADHHACRSAWLRR